MTIVEEQRVDLRNPHEWRVVRKRVFEDEASAREFFRWCSNTPGRRFKLVETVSERRES